MLKFIMAVAALVLLYQLPTPGLYEQPSIDEAHQETDHAAVAQFGWVDGAGATGIGPF